MGIITKEVEVKLWGQNVKHYQSLGYKGKHGDIITVRVEDLQSGSNVRIQYLCDYCKKEVVTMAYCDYIRRTKEVNKIACRNCFTEKTAEVNLLRYGVTSYAKTEECIEKMRTTIKARYSVSHYSQTQEYKDKWNKTCAERYGENYRKQFADKAFETFREKTGYDFPSQSPNVREKITQSYVNHYGVDNPQLSVEIREQTEKTCLERYGYFTPLQSPEVKEKIAQTFYKNGGVPTSKQQLYIFNLYKSSDDLTELNFPVSYFNVDICFPKEKLIVEVDFGGHNLSVKTGQITQEEFNQKEIIRNNIIKREGYKQMRIISSNDKLPSDTTLLQMLSDARSYFSAYPSHSWIEFNIDTSSLRNAEHKDGIPYSYGLLRTIKESDLSNTTNQNNKLTKEDDTNENVLR